MNEEIKHEEPCCCNCKNQLKLRKHPTNKEFGKGSILEFCGYVCTAGEIGEGDSAVYSDKKHGLCECHEFKPNRLTEL